MGLSFPPSTFAATAGVSPAEAGLASGLLNTNRQVGGSIGLAALATIAADHTTSLLSSGAANAATALTSGYARAFGIAGLVSLASAVAAGVLLPSSRRRDEATVIELDRAPRGDDPVLEVERA
jgi:hypothetical protein